MKRKTFDGILIASTVVLKLCAFALVVTGSVFYFKASNLSKNTEEWKTTTEETLAEQGLQSEQISAAFEQTYEEKQAEVKRLNNTAKTASMAGIATLCASVVPNIALKRD